MKRAILSSMFCVVISCQTSYRKDIGGNDTVYSDTGNNALKLHFNPRTNTSYYYNINNESEIEVEVEGKDVINLNKSTVGVNYAVDKDSAGNFLLNLHYDKIHLYSKNGDKETEIDAGNAASTNDPMEKMLGALKNASVTAIISPAGEVKTVQGYKELGDKIMAGINAPDVSSRIAMQQKLDRVIGEGLIKKNIEQLFKLFPDSTLQIGDTWTIQSKQKGEIDFNVATTYTLKDIDDGIAIIESEGEMSNDKGAANIMDQAVTGDLRGSQHGKFEVDAQTGMMLKNSIKANVKGTLQIMGRDIPVTINNTVNVESKRKK